MAIRTAILSVSSDIRSRDVGCWVLPSGVEMRRIKWATAFTEKVSVDPDEVLAAWEHWAPVMLPPTNEAFSHRLAKIESGDMADVHITNIRLANVLVGKALAETDNAVAAGWLRKAARYLACGQTADNGKQFACHLEHCAEPSCWQRKKGLLLSRREKDIQQAELDAEAALFFVSLGLGSVVDGLVLADAKQTVHACWVSDRAKLQRSGDAKVWVSQEEPSFDLISGAHYHVHAVIEASTAQALREALTAKGWDVHIANYERGTARKASSYLLKGTTANHKQANVLAQHTLAVLSDDHINQWLDANAIQTRSYYAAPAKQKLHIEDLEESPVEEQPNEAISEEKAHLAQTEHISFIDDMLPHRKPQPRVSDMREHLRRLMKHIA